MQCLQSGVLSRIAGAERGVLTNAFALANERTSRHYSAAGLHQTGKLPAVRLLALRSGGFSARWRRKVLLPGARLSATIRPPVVSRRTAVTAARSKAL